MTEGGWDNDKLIIKDGESKFSTDRRHLKRQGQGSIKSKKIKRLDIREAIRQSGNITVKLEYTCTTIKGINNITQTKILKG
jgi:hypothetical protein